MTLEEFVARAHPDVPAEVAQTLFALVAAGWAPAFLVRHRAERIGRLDDARVTALLATKERWDLLRERQRFVAEEIARQAALGPGLRATIEATFDRDALDDLYLPHKRKRRSDALAAVEAGLAPLAEWIWNCGHGLDVPHPGQTLELWAFTFRSEAHGINDADAAIAGAEEILVERLAATAALRTEVRAALAADGVLVVESGPRAKPGGRFAAHAGTQDAVATLRAPEGAARYAAIRRGVNEGELVMRLAGPGEDPAFTARLEARIAAEACPVPDSPGGAVLARAAARALAEQLWPAAEAAVQKTLRSAADDLVLADIAAGARRMLTTPPFGARPVLGVEPAPRGGCKVAGVDASGRLVEHAVVHLGGDERRAQAAELLAALIERHAIEAVAVADGIAVKETLRSVRELLRGRGILVPVVSVTDLALGAWVAGDTARTQLPDTDRGVRAAVAVARRLQDPLAQLAEVEPAALASGPYAHDVSQPRLEHVLAATLAGVVADVGVDPNTASEAVLARVPGLGPGLAHAIVEHRTAHGPFADRAALRGVALMDGQAFEQAVTAVRVGDDADRADPRGVLEPPAFHPDVRTLAELRPGLVCPGTVTNVTAFGAFVDIGLAHDGLVHVSQLSADFVRDPHAVVHVGDRVEVRVLDVNREKQQIALSMKPPPAARPARAPERPAPRAERDGERRPPRRPDGPRGGKPREPQRPAFNNPFAGLAAQLRGKTPTDRST